MKRHQTQIFGTRGDLEAGIRAFELQEQVKYVLLQLRTIPKFEEFASLLDVSSLGLNTTGDHMTGEQYLIVSKEADVRFETVPQKKGGIHYFVNQLINPDSIVFSPGGLYKNESLICGHIGTVCNERRSLELYKTFEGLVTKGFRRIGNYRVGREASHMMNQGIRMITMSVREPPEYDLKSK